MEFKLWKKKKTKKELKERFKKYKSSKRGKQRTPALEKGKNLKGRAELIDYDYVDKLSKEEKIWLNAFTEGWINADFRNPLTYEMFEDDKEKQACYTMNNARNRCMYTRAKTQGLVVDTKIEKKLAKESDNLNSGSDNNTKKTNKTKKLS